MPSLTKVQSGFMKAQGALPLSSGTAAAPGLKFDDSTGTGMFSPSTGVIGFSTGSTQSALTISTTGNTTLAGDLTINTDALFVDASAKKVGIGTTSPEDLLHISDGASGTSESSNAQLVLESGASTNYLVFQNPNDQNAGIKWVDAGGQSNALINYDHNTDNLWIGADDDILFAAAGSERMRINSSGSLLIGPAAGAATTITAAGAATFAGNICSGTWNTGNDYSAIKPGELNIYKDATTSDHVWQAGFASTITSSITGAGGATFASGITLTDGSLSVTRTDDVDWAAAFNCTGTRAYGVTINTPNNSNSNSVAFKVKDNGVNTVVIEPTGAAEFKGNVLVGDTTTTGTYVKATRSDSGNVWSGNSATDHTSSITKDGTASFKGDLRVGNTAAFAGTPLEIEVTGSSAEVGISLINTKDSDASATCIVRSYQDNRSGGDIVFGRENASDWSASYASADGFISFNPALNGSTVERLRIASDGQATFDKGAPSSSNQVIARFQCENSRKLDIVWHDSGSLMGFDTPGSHSYIFKCAGSEKFRIYSSGEVNVIGGSFQVANFHVRDGGWNSSGWDTGISVNQSGSGAVLLIMHCRNWDANDSTAAGLYLVRLGYNNNQNPQAWHVSGNDHWTHTKSSNNTLLLGCSSGNMHSTILWTT